MPGVTQQAIPVPRKRNCALPAPGFQGPLRETEEVPQLHGSAVSMVGVAGGDPGARPSHLPGTGLSLKKAEATGTLQASSTFSAVACLPARPALGESIASLREG